MTYLNDRVSCNSPVSLPSHPVAPLLRFLGTLKVSFSLAVLSTLVFVSGAVAGELGDVFAPIEDSTTTDPAGMYLMFGCIGLLVFLVSTIFVGTLIYMSKSKKDSSHQQ